MLGETTDDKGTDAFLANLPAAGGICGEKLVICGRYCFLYRGNAPNTYGTKHVYIQRIDWTIGIAIVNNNKKACGTLLD